MRQDDLHELQQFFGAYFHQDWALDSSGPDDVVRLFIEDCHSAGELQRLAHEIEEFIAESPREESALEQRLFQELGCYYRPSGHGVTTTAWLRHVAELLTDSANRISGKRDGNPAGPGLH